MRKVAFGGANSLDNFSPALTTRYWLLWGKEAAAIMTDYWRTIDTVLIGRKTYEVAIRSGKGGRGIPGDEDLRVSRTLAGGLRRRCGHHSSGCGRVRARPEREDGKDICLMGGGELARSLFEAGLIDEIGFNIHPVPLCAGIPLFHTMSRQIDLS